MVSTDDFESIEGVEVVNVTENGSAITVEVNDATAPRVTKVLQLLQQSGFLVMAEELEGNRVLLGGTR